MSELEVVQVTPLERGLKITCEGCGERHARFDVAMREYQDGAFQGIGSEDEFKYCNQCRKNALDLYSEFLGRKSFGPLRSQPWFRQKLKAEGKNV